MTFVLSKPRIALHIKLLKLVLLVVWVFFEHCKSIIEVINHSIFMGYSFLQLSNFIILVEYDIVFFKLHGFKFADILSVLKLKRINLLMKF